MAVTPTHPIPQEPAWVPELLGQLSTKPSAPEALVTALRTNHPRVTVADAETQLRHHPLAHEADGCWVNLLAAADGTVFTHLLDEAEYEAGALDADGDLDLWARLAGPGDGLPLADGGGEVRPRWFPDTVADADVELVGPDGWLDRFEPGKMLAVRLRDGALELNQLDTADEFTEDPEPLREVLECAMTGAWAAFKTYLRLRDEDDEVEPVVEMEWLAAALVVNHPDTLRTPLPPLPYILQLGGLEVVGAGAALPGVPLDRLEAAELSDEELWARVHVAGFVRACADEDQPRGDEDNAHFLDVVANGGLLEYAADLVEREGLPEATTDRLRALAGTPDRRAAAALLAARSAEGDGQPVRAEELVTEALRHDPELAPALLDAAEYAATRGELIAAERYFKRAGVPRGDARRVALARVVAPPASSTGRNQPCPCGSGRKHKLCCLRGAVHPLPRRALPVYARLAWWVQRAPRREVVTAFKQLIDLRRHLQADLLALDLAIFDTGLVDDYLEVRGPLLPADERALVEHWRQHEIAPYEVTQVRDGAGVTLRPLLGGEAVELRDRAFSTCVRRLDLIVARILRDGERPCLIALPSLVPRLRRRELLSLFEDYQPAALAAFFGPQPPPKPTNRDGHDLVFSEASYKVPGDAGAAWQRLAGQSEKLSGERLVADDDDPDRLTLFRPVDEMETVVCGSIQRDGSLWTVETNSVERLTALQTLVGQAAPDAELVDESTERADRALSGHAAAGAIPPGSSFDTFAGADPGGLGGPDASGASGDAGASGASGDAGDAGDAGASGASGASGDEVAAEQAMAEFLRHYEQRWLDQPVPALDGMTPRQAAGAGGEPLTELRALLDDIEWQGSEYMDADRLRTDLGV